MRIDGVHHVTAITPDVGANLDFNGRLLGLRLVWQGVNADDPGVRHIAYGDERGSPGSILIFFDMPGVARGRLGAGMVHRLVLRVAGDVALDFWERRFAAAGVVSERTGDCIVFADPDGLGLELVINDGEDEPLIAAAADIDGRLAIRGIHAVRVYSSDPEGAAAVLGGVLEMVHDGEGRWLARGERRHGLVIYDTAPGGRGTIGTGSVHHVAFTISDGDGDIWREHVAGARLRPTPLVDRQLFRPVYFREPGGVLFELATEGPGFVFEPPDRLGQSLVLIGDLVESRRQELERRFLPLANPRSPTSPDRPGG